MEKRAKGELTQERIEKCFIQLMTAKRWDRITVRELCEASNISRGTFYLYYDNIYDLMERIQNRLLRDFQMHYKEMKNSEQIKRSRCFNKGNNTFSADDPMRSFVMLFRFCRENRHAMIAMTDKEKGDPYFQKKFGDAVKLLLDKMMDQDGMPKDSMRLHYQNVILSIVFNTLPMWLIENQDLDELRVAKILSALRLGAMLQFRGNGASYFVGGRC